MGLPVFPLCITGKGARVFWWRITESNCYEDLAKVPGYHYINPPYRNTFDIVAKAITDEPEFIQICFYMVPQGRLELPKFGF
jgi:hypothetical protein